MQQKNKNNFDSFGIATELFFHKKLRSKLKKVFYLMLKMKYHI